MNNDFINKQPLGTDLIEDGLLTQQQLDQAIELQQRQGGRLGDILLENGWVEPNAFFSSLAKHFNKPFVDLFKNPPDPTLYDKNETTNYLKYQILPWKKEDDVTYITTCDPTPDTMIFIKSHFGEQVDFVVTSKFDLMWLLQNNASEYYQSEEANNLNEKSDGNSDDKKVHLENKLRIGEHLVLQGLISEEQLQQAIELQKQWGSRLGDIILAKGWIKAYQFYEALSKHYQRPFVNFTDEPMDESLFDLKQIDGYLQYNILPWRERNGTTYVALYNPTPEAIEFAVSLYGENVDFVVTSKFDIMWKLQDLADEHFSDIAVNGLAERLPEQSALEVFTRRQLLWFAGLCYLFVMLVTIWPIETLSMMNLLVAVFLLCNFGLRWVLTWVGGDEKVDLKVTDHMVSLLEDHELPIYTVLVPMYKEPDTLPILSAALRDLDYPLSKLDIKLVLEADDKETIQAAKDLGLESIFEIIRVPVSSPKTKPKACNYALTFSRGELVTIYDAEDKPEPDQLKKAVIAFRQATDDTVCIQARLNYFNANENWLTRMFTLEYSLWFDFYLPALEKLKIPIPLGGTSNHFKMDVLREVHAWDPYNVTEDADLGVRITQLGYRVGVVNSTTYEEANTQFGNWIRQRSRWIKGYMQTYLVHMRKPIELYRSLGPVGFWGFQFFVGGTIVSTLLPPFLYGMFFFWLITGSSALNDIFPPSVLYISLINMLIGNGFFIYISGLGAFKRQNYKLIAYSITAPFYWLLMSVAAYKGLWQLIYNPFYWEKTVHGISRFKHDELEPDKNEINE